jgi:N-methylhydantoinase A
LSSTPSSSVRLAVDVGGTFTDVVSLDIADGTLHFDKVPTTPSEPSKGVLNAFVRAGAETSRVSYFAHGTTLGLNALLTRTGAKTAIVTTQGFRDVYLLGRTDRTPVYDFKYARPEGLVKRSQIFEVPERMNYQGEVLTTFDRDAAKAVAESIRDAGIEAVAVCFLHAYANPAHELAMREALSEVIPDVHVTLSHELTREYREYERTSTAVFDSYIKPVVRRYIGRLQGALEQDGFLGKFFMIRSGGGAMTASRAKDAPVNLILSGPAGGVIGAASFAVATNEPNLITIDMGGTSLDASLIIEGQPLLHHEATFDNLPITIPSLNIHTIGAGGGSLVWIDEGGHLQVGPKSAGADPGPAAYGQGGTQATFTDAALVLGYLGTETALAGTLRLNKELAQQALSPSADALDITVDDVAFGVVRIAVTKIVGAVRAITVEAGHSPRDFAMLTFGGGGGLVAIDVARELSIPRVIVPPGPGAFSALGMLMADVQHDFSRTRVTLLDEADLTLLEQQFSDMTNEANVALEAEGFAPDQRKLLRFADMRYQGQEHTVSLPVGPVLDAEEVKHLKDIFAESHERHYGHSMDDPIEIVTLRSRALGLVERPSLPELGKRESGELAPVDSRPVYRGNGTWQDYPVYHRESFLLGDRIEGPAVINEHTSTTVMHAGDTAVVGRLGEIQITLAKEDDRG